MKKLIILLLVVSNSAAYSQDVRLGFYSGFGTYRMQDLKDLQSELVIESLHVKKTEEFPGYINYVLVLEYGKDKHAFGINTGFYMTGGRNHVSDYSGEYSLKMPVNGFRGGIQYRYLYPVSGGLSVFGRLSGGFMLTSLEITESFEIFNVNNNTNSYKFKSSAFFFEPSVGLSFPLWKNISLESSLGYQVNLENKLHLKGNKKAYLEDSSGDTVKADWSGIRLLIGILFELD